MFSKFQNYSHIFHTNLESCCGHAVHVYNLSTVEAKAGYLSLIQGHPGYMLHLVPEQNTQ